MLDVTVGVPAATRRGRAANERSCPMQGEAVELHTPYNHVTKGSHQSHQPLREEALGLPKDLRSCNRGCWGLTRNSAKHYWCALGTVPNRRPLRKLFDLHNRIASCPVQKSSYSTQSTLLLKTAYNNIHTSVVVRCCPRCWPPATSCPAWRTEPSLLRLWRPACLRHPGRGYVITSSLLPSRDA